MDFETISAENFGQSLTGLGLNILTRDVQALTAFLVEVFEMKAYRVSEDFAITTYAGQVFQLHADATYHSHPLLSLLPEAGARGAGVELRLYDTDPDEAAARAQAFGATLLQAPQNKPHGLRECVILSDEGYAWLPSRALSEAEAQSAS